MEDALISTEFTLLRLKPGVEVDSMYLLSVLRSAAVVAEMRSDSSGVGRHRVDWSRLKNTRIPLLPYPEQKEIGDIHPDIMEREKVIREKLKAANAAIEPLDLEGET